MIQLISLYSLTYCHLLPVLVSYLLLHDGPNPAKVQAQKHTQQNIVIENPSKQYWDIMFCQYCTPLGQIEMFCECFTMSYPLYKIINIWQK